jgi:hypothetical protein
MPEASEAEQLEQPGQLARTRKRSATSAIHFPDPVDASGSTAIPNSVLDDQQLAPETRLVYIMLRRLAAIGRGHTLDQRELADQIGIPAHRIPRHLTLLQRRGLPGIDEPPSTRTPIRYTLEAPTGDLGGGSAHRLLSEGVQAVDSPDRLSLVDRLIILGVDPHIADQLVAKYPKERVPGALRAAHRRRPRPRDPAAWVVAAIRQEWVSRSAAVATQAWQAAQDEAIAVYERHADAALATLPTATRQSLRRRATEVIERGSARVWPPPRSAPC